MITRLHQMRVVVAVEEQSPVAKVQVVVDDIPFVIDERLVLV